MEKYIMFPFSFKDPSPHMTQELTIYSHQADVSTVESDPHGLIC